MKKKIKISLILRDDFSVKNLEELRMHFDLERVIHYYKTGELSKFLHQLYYDEAYEIDELDMSQSDFAERLCSILNVEYHPVKKIAGSNRETKGLSNSEDNKEIAPIGDMTLNELGKKDAESTSEIMEPTINSHSNQNSILNYQDTQHNPVDADNDDMPESSATYVSNNEDTKPMPKVLETTASTQFEQNPPENSQATQNITSKSKISFKRIGCGCLCVIFAAIIVLLGICILLAPSSKQEDVSTNASVETKADNIQEDKTSEPKEESTQKTDVTESKNKEGKEDKLSKEPSKPSPEPAAPKTESTNVVKDTTVISYKRFHDDTFDYSFEYPSSYPDFVQAPSDGTAATYYKLEFKKGYLLVGNEFTSVDVSEYSPEMELRFAEDLRETPAIPLNDYEYRMDWNTTSEHRVRYVRIVPFRGKMIRLYVELRQTGNLSNDEQEIVQHVIDSLQP